MAVDVVENGNVPKAAGLDFLSPNIGVPGGEVVVENLAVVVFGNAADTVPNEDSSHS